jgi:voltage-dependent calcium channel
VFELRIFPIEYGITNLMRTCVPDPVANASGRLVTAVGTKRAVDIRHVQRLIAQLDPVKLKARRKTLDRLLAEAKLVEQPVKGISFTAMLTMLAHYKLIDDEQALG